MKKLLLFAILAILASSWSCDKEDEVAVISADVKIGDTQEGGKVFYIAPDRSFGLIAAPEDVNENGVAWSVLRVTIVTENKIGTGAANTKKIVKFFKEIFKMFNYISLKTKSCGTIFWT